MRRSDGERCLVELVSEFYNNVAALLPLLMLTKVVDRHRRQHMEQLAVFKSRRRDEDLRHRAFLVLAALTEALALLSAGWDHHQTWPDLVLIGLVAICGLFFTVELVAGRLAEQ
jgi:hypothetical protein